MKSQSLVSLVVFTTLSSLFFTGCASLDRGVPQKVSIDSSPPGATVFINGEEYGVTPLEVKLARKLNHEIRMEKTGFQPVLEYIAPASNGQSRDFVRLGIFEDLGYYVDLEPRALDVALKTKGEK
ncbi:MAG: PEGA domain-containing protein [Opitutaceae bacterium]